MAFDWNNVEGYRDDMSADEKLALLDNYQPATPTEPEQSKDPAPKPAPEPKAAPKPGYIPKKDFDKLSSDYASLKKQLRAKLTEEEQREADRQAAIEAQEEELKTLRREKELSLNTASFMGIGLTEDLANEASTAWVDHDSDAFFAALKRHQTGYEKALRAKILAETPKPPASADPNGDEAKKQDMAQLRGYFGLPHKT